MQGILSLYGTDVCVLFYTGSTHSFIAPRAVCHIPVLQITLSYYLIVTMSGDTVLMGSEVFKDYKIVVHDRELSGDLIMFDIKDFDLILGMNWLSRHYAKVDYRQKVNYFELPQ